MNKMIILEKCKDLKFFLKKIYRRTNFISFYIISRYENKKLIEMIDLRHQLDHITLKKIQLFQEYVIVLIMLDCF